MPGTQACALDWVKAYRCSPITFDHKRFIASFWRDLVFPNHCAPFGLSTSGNIQGAPADAFRDILIITLLLCVFKWVDDYNIWQTPTSFTTLPSGEVIYSYSVSLQDILDLSAPLGVQWHDISKKGHDFASITTYVGFMWDLERKKVYLSEVKRIKHLRKVHAFLLIAESNTRVNYAVTSSLHGSLQHLCFVYRQGRSYLSSLSLFTSKFPNKFISHYIPSSVKNDVTWWKRTLSLPSVSRSLIPRTFHDPDIWVDASEWGIGLVVGDFWAAWKLVPGWRGDGRDMGWAEGLAVEVITLWIVSDSGIANDAIVKVRSDNTGVIGAHNRGWSRNIHVNDSIRRVSTLFISTNTTPDFEQVPSALNRADPISRGDLGPADCKLKISFDLPVELKEFLVHV